MSRTGVEIREVEQYRDPRGWAFEPVAADTLGLQRNAHVVWTEPGCVRGNHVHRRETEILLVRGPARVRYREAGADVDVDVPPGTVLSFTIPPGVPHGVLNTGAEANLIVAFRDAPFDPADPDVEPVPLLEPRDDCAPAP